jgi:uncharacterized repeat protein (TIGR02543 family)
MEIMVINLRIVKWFSLSLILISGSLYIPINNSSSAHADEPSVSIYADAPFVQASYVPSFDGSAITETFDDYWTGYDPSRCPETIAVGTIDIPNNCLIYGNVPTYGGATTLSSDPTTGGSPSPYAAVHASYEQLGPITITFNKPEKYVGFWWSAGSLTNDVKFYSQGKVVADFNIDSLYKFLRSQVSQSKYDSTCYLGNPLGYDTTLGSGAPYLPEDPACINANSENPFAPDEQFVYIHVFTQGTQTIDSMQIFTNGNGFEFDNLTVSDLEIAPLERLVPVEQLYAPYPVTYDLNLPQASDAQWGYGENLGTSGDTNFYGGNSFFLPYPPYQPWSPTHLFTGWQGSDGQIVTQHDSYYAPWSNNEITLTATWIPLYTVSYALDGGDASNIFLGESTWRPDAPSYGCFYLGSEPIRSGYSFVGWQGSDGQTFTPSQMRQEECYYPSYPTTDITLTALWEPTGIQSSSSIFWKISSGDITNDFASLKYSTQSSLVLSRSFDPSLQVSNRGIAYLRQATLSSQGDCVDWNIATNTLNHSSENFSLNVLSNGTLTSSTLIRGYCYQWSEDSNVVGTADIGPTATDSNGSSVNFTPESLTSGTLKLPPKISANWPSTIPVDPRLNKVDLPPPSSISGSATSVHFCVMQGSPGGSKSGTTLSFKNQDLEPISGDSAFSLDLTAAGFSNAVQHVQVSTSDIHKFLTDSYVLVRTLPSYPDAISHCDSDPSNPFEIQPIAGEAAIMKISPYGLTRTLHLPTIDLGHHR